jgi:hypothetical protein
MIIPYVKWFFILFSERKDPQYQKMFVCPTNQKVAPYHQGNTLYFLKKNHDPEVITDAESKSEVKLRFLQGEPNSNFEQTYLNQFFITIE